MKLISKNDKVLRFGKKEVPAVYVVLCVLALLNLALIIDYVVLEAFVEDYTFAQFAFNQFFDQITMILDTCFIVYNIGVYYVRKDFKRVIYLFCVFAVIMLYFIIKFALKWF